MRCPENVCGGGDAVKIVGFPRNLVNSSHKAIESCPSI